MRETRQSGSTSGFWVMPELYSMENLAYKLNQWRFGSVVFQKN
ncbi:MAG: hypothetical protein ACP5NL_07195 [Thermoplasmata archaeon]